jgi:NADH-quinone oxidoreductase subunit J
VESTGVIIGFWALAGLTVGAAALVFVARNLLHAVLALVLSFVGMAGLFLTLSADFIAMAQILIYAGAISVLLVFAVMLTPLASRDNANSLFALPGLAVGGAFAALLGFAAIEVDWAELRGSALAERAFDDTIAAVGRALVDRYAFAFELASVLLLIALIGAIALVREDGEP